ncbi:MAG: hypothetical protein IPI44_23420 [Sulfuritalea sp.]|nr:hypothetical protein [Sulfuritalea sp.]
MKSSSPQTPTSTPPPSRPCPPPRKIHVTGSRPDIRVPMREIAQSPTGDT